MSIIKDYKFKDIEKYLKKDSNVGKDIIEAFKHLSDAAIIFAPIILGPKLDVYKRQVYHSMNRKNQKVWRILKS